MQWNCLLIFIPMGMIAASVITVAAVGYNSPGPRCNDLFGHIGNPTEVENINPNCPNGEVAIAIPADASSVDVKKVAEEMTARYAGCRTTLTVGPKRESNGPQKANSAPPLPLLP